VTKDLLGRSDVLVIGGGIVGCATAYYLARAGRTVRLLERGQIASEQSSRAWGFVRQQGRHAAEVPLAAEASRIWEGLAGELQADLEFVRRGIVVPAETIEDEQRFVKAADLAQKHGLSTRMISSAELKQLIPELAGDWRAALYTAEDGHAEPRKSTEAFAAAGERLGVTFHSNTSAVGLEVRNGAATAAVTASGRYEADSILCAGGAGAAPLLRTAGIPLPIQIVRSSVAQTKQTRHFTSLAMWGPYVSFRPKGDGSFYIGNGYRGVGADYEITMESLRNLRLFLPAYRRNWRLLRLRLGRRFVTDFHRQLSLTARFAAPPEPEPNLDKIRHNERRFYELFPALAGLGLARSWAGWIDLTPDLIPIIGAVRSPKRVYVAAGFSGHGFALGPAIGKLMAQLIVEGRSSIDLARFRPSRFVEGDYTLPSAAL
jgi:glycine/D-amino acid oxidase-like deaminating enzyme